MSGLARNSRPAINACVRVDHASDLALGSSERAAGSAQTTVGVMTACCTRSAAGGQRSAVCCLSAVRDLKKKKKTDGLRWIRTHDLYHTDHPSYHSATKRYVLQVAACQTIGLLSTIKYLELFITLCSGIEEELVEYFSVHCFHCDFFVSFCISCCCSGSTVELL